MPQACRFRAVDRNAEGHFVFFEINHENPEFEPADGLCLFVYDASNAMGGVNNEIVHLELGFLGHRIHFPLLFDTLKMSCPLRHCAGRYYSSERYKA